MAKSRNPVLEFDGLQMYFGEPYHINLDSAQGEIIIYSPTIGELIEVGEKRFYQTLNVFCTNTTANRLMLWEIGIDWNELSDFELFTLLLQSADPEVCKIFFKDQDLTKFERMAKQIDDKQVLTLYNKEDDVEINEEVYFHISQYLRSVFHFYPEEKFTKDSTLKKWFIDADKRQRQNDELRAKKNGPSHSNMLQTQVSAYINHPGTKYKLRELKEVGVCEFFDSLQRLQIYESATALMKGMYSGFVDGKKIKPEEYNFMREIKNDSKS